MPENIPRMHDFLPIRENESQPEGNKEVVVHQVLHWAWIQKQLESSSQIANFWRHNPKFFFQSYSIE